MGRVVEVNTGSYGKGGVLLPLVQLAMNLVASVERGLLLYPVRSFVTGVG